MSKVFVIHDIGKFDLHDAERFGEIVPIFTNNVSLLDSNDLYRTIDKKLEQYREGDYILCSGSPVLIFLVGTVLGDLGVERINFLVWDKKYNCYIKILT